MSMMGENKGTLIINEIFKSIQGEGRYQGTPVTFVRMSGCTRKCEGLMNCDTSYHVKGVELKFEEVQASIMNHLLLPIVFTGGEPLLQWDNLFAFLAKYFSSILKTKIHLESNGDLIKSVDDIDYLLSHFFRYVCFSPKEAGIAKLLSIFIEEYKANYCCREGNICDIKVVTDLDKYGMDILPYATMLMPLTTYNETKDKKIRRKVWNYCVKKKLFYSARLHINVWGKKRKI